uniref:ST8 alpha-N-acetyl-neuraminide alpha-2,8-sialyltransferase 7.1 n=1 Tax=Sinocyclocheilus rhinocerous TaxID=307959 RepID=A0A673GMC0_9TELE
MLINFLCVCVFVCVCVCVCECVCVCVLCFCCNATGSLFLTKQNTAINQAIPYETSATKTYKMNAAIHSMLPEDFPWSGRRLGRCAVVGSGGILKNSSCGSEIDSADFVIRFNLASINDSDVGLKTDLITINPSQIRFKNLEQNPDPLVERVSVYGNASLAIPAFAYTFCTGQSIKTLKVLHPIRPQQPVAFFSPIYLRTLDRFWKGRGLKSIRLSSGFMLINTALELCEDVHVYGFWPFDTNLQDIPVPYHYYDQMRPHRVCVCVSEFQVSRLLLQLSSALGPASDVLLDPYLLCWEELIKYDNITAGVISDVPILHFFSDQHI